MNTELTQYDHFIVTLQVQTLVIEKQSMIFFSSHPNYSKTS